MLLAKWFTLKLTFHTSFLPEILPPTEILNSSHKKSENHKETEAQPPSKQDKLVLSGMSKQSDTTKDRKTYVKALSDLKSGISKLQTRDQRSRQKPRNESSPECSTQEPSLKEQTKTVTGASVIATEDVVKDTAKRSASAEKGEAQVQKQSRVNDIKLKEQDTTKSEAATTKTFMTEETSQILPYQSNNECTKESNKIKVETAKSDILPSEVVKDSSGKLEKQVETEAPAKAESLIDQKAEIETESIKFEQTNICSSDSTERDNGERSKLGADLKPEDNVPVDPVLPEQSSEVKCVKQDDATSTSSVSCSVDPELANKATMKLLTDQNIIPVVGKGPSFASSFTAKVEENSLKEVGSNIQTEAVTVLAKNVEIQVDKGVPVVAGQQRDSNERPSDPAVGNTDSLNSCRDEPDSIIMQDRAEEKVPKPGKPITLSKLATAEQMQASATGVQVEKKKTKIMGKEQVEINSENKAKNNIKKETKETINNTVENKIIKKSSKNEDVCLNECSGQEQKDIISVVPVECSVTPEIQTKDKKASSSNQDTIKKVMRSQTSEQKPQRTTKDSSAGRKEGALIENTSNTADIMVSVDEDQTTSTAKLQPEKSTLPVAKGPVATAKEESEMDTTQLHEVKSVEGVIDTSLSRVLSNATPTENQNDVGILEKQKAFIQNTVLPESKMADRVDNQPVTPQKEQKLGILDTQAKDTVHPKTKAEEDIKTEMKESKDLAKSPKVSSVIINDKTISEMDKKQHKLSVNVPEVTIKEAKQGDQKKSTSDVKKGENKVLKMPDHSDAQGDSDDTKTQTKTSVISKPAPAQGKKSATPTPQLKKESPSSWLDVEHQTKKKKEPKRILDASASEDESLEPDDLDEFIRSIRESSTPFTQPLKKHNRKKTPSPTMPAIKEDNFDPDSFQFGLRKEGTIFKDPSPAMVIKQNSAKRKERVQDNASRDQPEGRLQTSDGVDGTEGIEGGAHAGKDEQAVNGEEAGQLSSRLQRISILSSLMSSPWSSRKVREEVASAKNSEVPPSGEKAGAALQPLEADKEGVVKGKSQSPAAGRLSALSELAGGADSPPASPSFPEVKLPAHLEKYMKKRKSEAETPQAPNQSPLAKVSPKGSAGKNKASMAGAPNSLKSSVNGLSTSKPKVRPELWIA